MTNQTARFTSTTDATLAVVLFEGKHNIKVVVRLKAPNEGTTEGAKSWFDLGQDAEAQLEFDNRVKEAVAAGWVLTERAAGHSRAFDAIPPAPGKLVEDLKVVAKKVSKK
jgi:hypothetical protein